MINKWIEKNPEQQKHRLSVWREKHRKYYNEYMRNYMKNYTIPIKRGVKRNIVVKSDELNFIKQENVLLIFD